MNRNIVKNSEGELIAMARNMQIVITDDEGQERATYRITYGARLKVDEGATVKRGERLAEWNPNALPVLTEVEGTVEVSRIWSSASPCAKWRTKRPAFAKVVMDSRGTRGKTRRNCVRPSWSRTRRARSSSSRAAARRATCISPDAILSVEDGSKVTRRRRPGAYPTEGAKTRDITGGLPRVAELFEARKPKEAAVMAETDGFVEFGKDYKNKRRISIEPVDKNEETREYLIPKGKHISVREGDYVEKGDYIVEGNPAPHDILASRAWRNWRPIWSRKSRTSIGCRA